MDTDIVKRGYLKVVGSKGGLGNSLSRFGVKKHWVVLRAESQVSKCRIEIFKGEDDVLSRKNPLKVIGIEQISNIQSSIDRKEMNLVLFGETVTLTCSSRADHDDWLRDIESLRHSPGGGKKAAPSVPDDEQFRVRLRQTASLLFHGPCLLEIQRDFERNLFHIALFCDEVPPRLIVKWQIDHIRQYGSNEVAFKFQSGSKSPTRVDWFILDTNPGDAPKIHRAVDYWAHHIVEQAQNIAPPPPRRDSINTRPLPISPSSPPHIPRPLSMSASVPTNGIGNSTYQPLSLSTRQQAPIYDGIDNRQLSSPSNVSPPSGSGSGGASVYQSLTPTVNGTSEYAGLDEMTRIRTHSAAQMSSSLPSVSPQGAEYMGLNMSTRNRQDATYMDINPTKT